MGLKVPKETAVLKERRVRMALRVSGAKEESRVIRVHKGLREPRVLRAMSVVVDLKVVLAHRELRVLLEQRVHRVPQEHRDNVVPKGTKEIRAVSVPKVSLVIKGLQVLREIKGIRDLSVHKATLAHKVRRAYRAL